MSLFLEKGPRDLQGRRGRAILDVGDGRAKSASLERGTVGRVWSEVYRISPETQRNTAGEVHILTIDVRLPEYLAVFVKVNVGQ